MAKKKINITIEIYDETGIEEIERIVSAALDSNGIDCIYDIKEDKHRETKTPVIEININTTITGITKDFPIEKTIKAINEKTIVDGYSSLLI